MDIHEIREALKNEVATVVFKKRNGEIRTMICTLMPEYLPEGESSRVSGPPSEVTVTALDIEINEWRAFRYDSLISFETDEVTHMF